MQTGSPNQRKENRHNIRLTFPNHAYGQRFIVNCLFLITVRRIAVNFRQMHTHVKNEHPNESSIF